MNTRNVTRISNRLRVALKNATLAVAVAAGLVAGSDTFSGGTILNGGELWLEPTSHTALGTGPVTLNDGTLRFYRINATNALIVNGGKLYNGVRNGIAYFMGMDGLATNPGVVAGKVTWPHVGEVASFEVQVSDTLASWAPAAPGDVDTTNAPGFVIYTLPPGAVKKVLPPDGHAVGTAPASGRLFVRVAAVPTPVFLLSKQLFTPYANQPKTTIS